MGINRDLAVESSAIDLCVCTICCGVLENVIMIKTCEHCFCEQCIDEWIKIKLQNNDELSCPECRITFTKAELGTSRLLRNLLSSIELRCMYPECFVLVRYDDYEQHRTDCKLAEISCVVCKLKMRRCDYNIHNFRFKNYIPTWPIFARKIR